MRNEIAEELKNFYEQYLYIKDIYNVFLDSSLAEDCSGDGNVFFQMVTSACVDSYMMTLARMFDEDSKSAGIAKLINKCKQQKDLFNNPDDVFVFLTDKGRSLKKDRELKNALEVIRQRRNHYFAHNDQEYFLHVNENDKAVQDESYLPSYQIWMLINFVKDLLVKLMDELNVNYDEMRPKYGRELSDLVPSIKERQITPI